LTIRFNNQNHVLVVLQASPAGAAGGRDEVVEEARALDFNVYCFPLIAWFAYRSL
jgi:hypothetical protein